MAEDVTSGQITCFPIMFAHHHVNSHIIFFKSEISYLDSKLSIVIRVMAHNNLFNPRTAFHIWCCFWLWCWCIWLSREIIGIFPDLMSYFLLKTLSDFFQSFSFMEACESFQTLHEDKFPLKYAVLCIFLWQWLNFKVTLASERLIRRLLSFIKFLSDPVQARFECYRWVKELEYY